MNQFWLYLLAAGFLEVLWAVGFKFTGGFTKPLPSLGVVAVMVLSFALLNQAIKGLPIGTAYAVWTGIGAAGTALVGIVFLGEPISFLRLLCLAFIVLGVVGLKLFS